ncbi:MAG TPA: FliH/SctL family protein [Candidatus Tumulicola sp.]|jgi:flagellar biosynthesis/type III secretory pathway protein FliH
MHDEFVPLYVALAPATGGPLDESSVERDGPGTPATASPATPPSDFDDALSSARRFRAAVADALALSLERLVRDIACDVLARELALAPADVASIAARVLDRYFGERPVCVRVHPDDARACESIGVPVVVDGRLRAGDVVLDVRCGSIDASLGARLDSILP